MAYALPTIYSPKTFKNIERLLFMKMLKKEEWIVLAVFLLFASLFVYFNQGDLAGITGMATSDASFDVVLTKTKLNVGEQLPGYLNITFSGLVDPATNIKVSIPLGGRPVLLTTQLS